MLLLGIILVGISPLLSAFALGDEDRLLVDISLSTMLCCGLFLGSFTAASNLGDEIHRAAGPSHFNFRKSPVNTTSTGSATSAGLRCRSSGEDQAPLAFIR